MTLDEIFEKYTDDCKFKRAGELASYPVEWLKNLKIWANEESRQLGFIIPQIMIDNANANDWEEANEF